jgi:hypothetical protein
MHWYNPTIRNMESVPAPVVDAQAIKLLSGHPNSNEFIEVYRRVRATHPNIEEALIHTGEDYYEKHLRGRPPE